MPYSKETDKAILIADLAGYTALTEAHGNRSAAEIVTRYLHIVQESLQSDATLVERVGDEVLIMAPEAASVIWTAVRIREAVEQEPCFPTLHAGIHAGNLLSRTDISTGLPSILLREWQCTHAGARSCARQR